VKQEGPRRASVRELAAAAGVSPATVSRVLNDSPLVVPATRDRVLAAAAALDVAPPLPRADARPSRPAVFVRCPYVLTDYFGFLVSAVADTLERHGRPLVLSAGNGAQHEDPLATLASRRDVAGAILVLPREPASELAALGRAGFPFVVLDPRTRPPEDVVAVSANQFAAARRLTEHLLELGHRRIGVVGGPPHWLASVDRLAGIRAALAGVGVLLDPQHVRPVDDPRFEDGAAAAADLLDLADRPTALVCFNDKVAVGALRAAADRGLRVPEDLSVTGFDDLEVGHVSSPTLTTVRQPLAEMGRMSVSLLARRLAGHELDAVHVELATQLVVRGSTGPVARSR